MALAQIGLLKDADATAVASRDMFESEGNRYWISVVDFCLAYVRMAAGDVAKARLLAAQAKLQFQDTDMKRGMAESVSKLGSMVLEPTQFKATAAACMA